MTESKFLPGKFVWFELVAQDAKKAQAFYGEVLGWKVQPVPLANMTYEMISAAGTMMGGYAPFKAAGKPPHWISYVSVEDVDATVKAATANGGKVIDAPYDIPGVGRTARIADPQGAELCPFRGKEMDPPDVLPPNGGWCWNELHTRDLRGALAFYEKVVGFSHRPVPDAQIAYQILSRDGIDRGGVTDMGGERPHWLPYVAVDDADGTLARAKRLGGTICAGPQDIPNVGRFGVLQDPTGAALAVLKPLPKQR
jgi:predicted enzyme related to lactoylglutathione lyase